MVVKRFNDKNVTKTEHVAFYRMESYSKETAEFYEKSKMKHNIQNVTFGGEVVKVVQPIRDPEKIEAMKTLLRASSERNYIMFCLGIYTGLRVSDFRRIKVIDVLNTDHIVIVEQKTRVTKEGKRRPPKHILILPQLKKALAPYIKDKSEDDYLLKSQKGDNKPLKREMITGF